MKLTVIQAQSLANKIYRELLEENKKKTIISSQEIIKKVSTKDLKVLNEKLKQINKLNTEVNSLKTKMVNDVRKELGCSQNYNFHHFFYQNNNTVSIQNVSIPLNISVPFNIGTIKDELIVATISESDVDKIVKNIKQKYSK